jgi:predicted O-methyltransferase YrrM
MPKLAHWTPRYLLNRAKWWCYEKKNPDKPWLTPDSISALQTMLRPTDRGIEWGSGRSTAWFAKRMAHLTSVECEPEWYEKVKAELQKTGLSNVDYQFKPRTPPDDFVGVVDQFRDDSLDFALVDSLERFRCAMAATRKIRIGGILVVDNINWYLDHPTNSPASRYGHGDVSEWSEFRERTRDWRMIWTTSGVTDTGMWIRAN